MTLQELLSGLDLVNFTPGLAGRLATTQVTAGYTCDLLSDILANAPDGGVAITIQAHLNVVAVAVHSRLAGVILAGGRAPDDEVIARATEEGVPLLGSREGAFDLSGRLYALGLRGSAA